MQTEYEVKSISKAVAIITALADNRFKGMSTDEVAAKAGLNSSAAYRTLKTLEQHGWVRFSEVGKQWQLDAALLRLSRAYERYTAEQINSIKLEHLHMTGEEYRNGKK